MPVDPLAPPRPELLALLDAIKDHPDDDTPRLVLADWLDEQDDPLDAQRAAFIRAHIARVRSGAPDAAAEVTLVLVKWWLGPLAEATTYTRFEFGLPVIGVKATRLLKPDAPARLASEAFAFVQYVSLEEAGGPRLEKLAAVPEFRFVPGVRAHPFTAPGVGSATKFFGSPNLSGLRHIDFRGVRPGAGGVQALATNPALARLRKLVLVHNRLVDKAAVALAGSPHLANLTHLDLSDNLIGDAGADALAVSKAFPNLRELDLSQNPRLTGHGKHFLRAAFGDRVKLS